MPFPTTSVIDSGGGADSTTPPGWTKDRSGGANAGIKILTAKFRPNDTTYDNSYRTTEVTGNDCEAFVTIDTLETGDNESVACAMARLRDFGTATFDGYQAAYFHGTSYGSGAVIRLQKFVNGAYAQIGSDYNVTTATNGDGIGVQCVGDQISAWHRRSGTWTQVILVTNAEITTGTKIGMEVKGDFLTNFGGGTYAAVTLDNCLPDADVVTTGWTTAPLFSKVNDASDATVIQATAV